MDIFPGVRVERKWGCLCEFQQQGVGGWCPVVSITLVEGAAGYGVGQVTRRLTQRHPCLWPWREVQTFDQEKGVRVPSLAPNPER